MKDKFLERNGILMALFLFQYSLLIPIMHFISSTIVSASSGIVLIIVFLIYNIRSKLNKKILLFFFLMVMMTIINAVVNAVDLVSVFPFYIYFVPVIFVFLFRFDYFTFIKCCCCLSIINFFVLCWVPFAGYANYMRFGYGMLPTVIFLYVMIFRYKDEFLQKRIFLIACVLVFCFSSMEMIVYGARGAFFAIILFVTIDRFLMYKEKIIGNVILILVVLLVYMNIAQILDILRDILSKIGIKAYAISKFSMAIRKGIVASSSGRDILYSDAMDKIKKHLLWGNGIDLSGGDDYVHNIFLQVTQDLGVFALLILVISLTMMLSYLFNKQNNKKDEKTILSVLFGIAIGRLMFSSTLWKRPEFWMLICFYICINNKKNVTIQSGR